MAVAVFLVANGTVENIVSVESEEWAKENYPNCSVVLRDESNDSFQIGDQIL